ncbi:ribulose-phosphate 3-epimerase [Oscillospiraceae bacterium OttesenSCG-928-F05]|nr:ribulose-phosphate 3-epimerase [Oscillospiraceae bacterium OttesenSCG-928-F05]
MIKLSPSILTCDFLHLERDILAACRGGADYIHVDVMDGAFVPNISIGLPIVSALRRTCPIPLDVHLMIQNPSLYVEAFAKAGAGIITVHYEAPDRAPVAETLKMIRAAGVKAGLSIKPGTPVTEAAELIPLCDLFLVMTVEPGFGGQGFIPDCMPKITEARRIIAEKNPACELEVDGGVGEQNIRDTVAAGADVIVVGSAIYRPEFDPEARTALLRECANAK